MVPADLIGAIRQRSVARVEKDKEFADLLRRVESYVSQKGAEHGFPRGDRVHGSPQGVGC